jgi:PAS domain S-box-containing protein
MMIQTLPIYRERNQVPMKDKLIRALAATADAAFMTDQDQRIVFWNHAAERTLDFTFHEVIRQPCHEILKGRDDRGRLVCREHCPVSVTALTGGAVAHYDTLVCTKSNGARWVNISTLAFLANGQSADTLLVHLFRDITQRKQNEQLLHQVLRVAKELDDAELPQGVPTASKNGPGTDLTQRELEVLSLLAHGLKTGAIAQSLSISPSTVRNHIRNILQKLNVHSRLEAVVYAIKNGLVTEGDGSNSDPAPMPQTRRRNWLMGEMTCLN